MDRSTPAPTRPVVFRDLSAIEFWLMAQTIGITKEGIVAAIQALPDEIMPPAQKAAALIVVREARTFLRADPLVNQIGALVDKSPADIDAAWVAAPTY